MADDALAPSVTDHQQPQHWLCRILNRSLSSKRNGFNYWRHLIVGKWQKMWKYFCFSSNRYSTSREDDHFNLMGECKTAVSPLPMQWRYCSLALSHQTVYHFTILSILGVTHLFQEHCHIKPTRNIWFALSLSTLSSSGESTGVCLVNLESNWLTSSSPDWKIDQRLY